MPPASRAAEEDALLKHITAIMVLALCIAGADASFADDFEAVPPVRHQATLKECGECHMAYQPALLPRESWAAMMDDLPNHFGEDASLPDKLAADIRAYLTGASEPARRNRGQPELRITGTRWWIHEHDDVRASAWRDPKVGAKSNCAACHKQAEQGYYDDDD
jgi:hypothetical protein